MGSRERAEILKKKVKPLLFLHGLPVFFLTEITLW